MSRKKILFVCVANTCRSAMAEYILKDMAGDKYDACSAGLSAYNGDTMEPYAIRVLDRKLAGNLHRLHRSRMITAESADDADVIVAMRDDYADMIKKAFPQCAEKVISIGEINMPFFTDDYTMEQCCESIKSAITELIKNGKI